MTKPHKPRYELTLEAEHDPSDVDGIRRMKLMLKRLLRTHRLRCLSIVPKQESKQ